MERLLAICLLFFILSGCSDAIHGKKNAPDAQDTESTLSILDAGPTRDRSTPSSNNETPTDNLEDGGASHEVSRDNDPSDIQPPEETEGTPDLTIPPESRAAKEVVQENISKPEQKEPTEPREPPKSNVDQSGFRILHWNIAGGKENNCKTEGITRAVMRFVRSFSQPVDFVNLNEVCEAQFKSIRDELRKHWKKKNSDTFFVFQPLNQRKVGLVFFSRHNLKGITRLKLGQDQYGDRYLLCARQTHRRVRFCGTHLTPADATARKQLALMMKKVESFWTDKRDTIIFAGDLNIHPHDSALNAVYSSAANTSNNPNNRGSYRELDDNDSSHCKGYGERTLPGTAGGPCRKGGKIDFIFARQNKIINNKFNADSLDIPNDCSGVCSDHRALRGYVQLEYRTD